MTFPDVVVPRRKIEILTDDVMIVAVEPSHHVGGNELPRIGVRANGIKLVFLITPPGIAHEASPTEEQARIPISRLNGNLVPIGVRLAPVRRGPAGIQVIESSISVLQPLLELRLRTRIVGVFCVLVINLPA